MKYSLETAEETLESSGNVVLKYTITLGTKFNVFHNYLLILAYLVREIKIFPIRIDSKAYSRAIHGDTLIRFYYGSIAAFFYRWSNEGLIPGAINRWNDHQFAMLHLTEQNRLALSG